MGWDRSRLVFGHGLQGHSSVEFFLAHVIQVLQIILPTSYRLVASIGRWAIHSITAYEKLVRYSTDARWSRDLRTADCLKRKMRPSCSRTIGWAISPSGQNGNP